jgi:hypothetical protein
MVLPEYSELQAHRQQEDEPELLLPPASGPAGS